MPKLAFTNITKKKAFKIKVKIKGFLLKYSSLGLRVYVVEIFDLIHYGHGDKVDVDNIFFLHKHNLWTPQCRQHNGKKCCCESI